MNGNTHTIFSRHLPQEIEPAVRSEQEADGRDRGASGEHAPGECVLVVGVVKVWGDALWGRESRSVQVHGGGVEVLCVVVEMAWPTSTSCEVEQLLGRRNSKVQALLATVASARRRREEVCEFR